jgi:hypothetical protein
MLMLLQAVRAVLGAVLLLSEQKDACLRLEDFNSVLHFVGLRFHGQLKSLLTFVSMTEHPE